jgi:hypothetical protein
MRTRLQSLGLVDRAIATTTDDELVALTAALDDDRREALARLVGGDVVPASIRAACARGRLSGTLESIAIVLADACLADCIEQLGDASDNPSSDQLRDVLPGVVERHGLAATRIMLASTVAGEAQAAPIIRDLLKHDELVRLPPAPPAAPSIPLPIAPRVSPEERAAIKAKRAEMKARKQAEARARREQALRARGRA